jgi:hyperosmotically inducible periplasmic protein
MIPNLLRHKGAPFRRCVYLGLLAVVLIVGLCGCLSHSRKQVGGSMLDDKVTTERVRGALKASDSKAFQDVRAETSGGVVTLSGVVHSEAERERAVQLAKDTHRASKVEDHIEVRR